MARTTAALVAKIIEVDSSIIVTPDTDFAPFIEWANAIITDVCVPLGYDDERLALIEKWLSAHAYAIRDPRITSEAAGKGAVSASYESKVDLNLNLTRYGQSAMVLDTKGGLASLQQKLLKGISIQPSITFIGKVCP